MSNTAGRISKNYRVAAASSRGRAAGYVGEYTFPGRDMQQVRDNGGAVVTFNSEDEAIAAAGEELCKALNSRTRGTLKHDYKRMGGAELAVALADLNITPAEFAILYGTIHKRVMDWMDGNEDIPHPVRVMLGMFTIPGALQLARQITSMVTSKKGTDANERAEQQSPGA